MDIYKTLIEFLKKKHMVIGNAEALKKDSTFSSVHLRKSSDLFIRDSILGLGTILFENLEKHYYITSVKVGFGGSVFAYALISRNEDTADIVTYSHEGLIRRHLSKKALEKIKKRLE